MRCHPRSFKINVAAARNILAERGAAYRRFTHAAPAVAFQLHYRGWPKPDRGRNRARTVISMSANGAGRYVESKAIRQVVKGRELNVLKAIGMRPFSSASAPTPMARC